MLFNLFNFEKWDITYSRHSRNNSYLTFERIHNALVKSESQRRGWRVCVLTPDMFIKSLGKQWSQTVIDL